MPPSVKRFILLGESGAGKSSFVNIFYNYCYGTRNVDDIFDEDQRKVRLAIPCKDWLDRVQYGEKSSERDINDQTKSQTIGCTSYMLHFNDITIELIDTPGFNDSDGVAQDDITLVEIEKALQKFSYLSGIIVVANGSRPRLGTSFQHFMRMLHQVWPNNLMQNMCAVLTNCDDTSCSLRSQALHADLKVSERAMFYLQNSLFRWDRRTRTSKAIRNLRRDFDDTIDVLEKLVPVLIQFNDVLTDVFKMSSVLQNRIQECIFASVQQMIELLQVNRSQRIVEEGLNGAKTTMAANTKWETEVTINAFKWMEVESASRRQPSNSNGSYSRTDDVTEISSLHGYDNTRSDVSNITDNGSSYLNNTSTNRDRDVESYSRYALDSGNPCTYDALQLNKPSNIHVSNQKTSYQSDFKKSPISDRDCHYPDNDHHQNSRCPKKYQRQSVKLQITLDDNEARSHHVTARQQAERLQDRAVKITKQHNQLIDSMHLLLHTLQVNVHKIRSVNTDIDLLERNKLFIQELRDEIQVWADEPGIIECYHKVVSILSKPTTVS